MEYCTLCQGLRKNLGILSSLFLNYECTFLYIFLSSLYPNIEDSEQTFRCPLNPLKKQTTKRFSQGLEYASFINYHLALLKIEDGIIDGNWYTKIIYRILYRILSWNRKYQSLKLKYDKVATDVALHCKDLYHLEQKEYTDYDQCSQTMGAALRSVVQYYIELFPIENADAVLAFAEHLGMWIYLIDAYDDYENDKKHGAFNPLDLVTNCPPHDYSTIIRSGEFMLEMMTMNLTTLQGQIRFYRHREIIENVVRFGTRRSVQMIKKKREGKNNDQCCKH